VLGTDIIERCDLTGGKIIEPAADRSERVLVREDLGGLLESFVLVDRDQHRGRSVGPRDRDMLTTVSHLVEQIGEVGAELPDGHGLRHASRCTSLCTHGAAGPNVPPGRSSRGQVASARRGSGMVQSRCGASTISKDPPASGGSAASPS
jgi:hypothetical protein